MITSTDPLFHSANEQPHVALQKYYTPQNEMSPLESANLPVRQSAHSRSPFGISKRSSAPTLVFSKEIRKKHHPLLDECADAIKLVKKMFGVCTMADDFDLQHDMVSWLDELREQCRQNRLSEQKHFKDHIKVIEGVFKSREKPLKNSINMILANMGDEMVKNTGADHSTEVDWVVTSIDRADVDLEALRPYFTDAAITTAVKKYLGEGGSNDLPGINLQPTAQLL